MNHEFYIDTTVGLLKEKFFGPLSLDILTEANKAILAHPDFKGGLNFLTDLTKSSILFNFEEMCEHVESLPSLQIDRQVFIVSKNREYGMIRMFLTLVEGDGIIKNGEVFKSLEEGQKWLTSCDI